MNSFVNYPVVNETSLWIQNLIHGLSGLSIKAKHCVFCGSSPFQKVEVFDTFSYGLVLCLGGTVVLTERDSESYHEMMVHPAMMMHSNPRRVCVIGGGDGGCLKEVLKYDCVKEVVVVEIDSLVKETVEKYIPDFATGFSDPRTEVILGDGYEYLRDSQQQFDLILVDSYDPGGPVRNLETEDFFIRVAQRLGDEGIAAFQTDSPSLREELLRNTIMQISPHFGEYKPYICTMRSFPEGVCSFVVASRKDGGLVSFDKERYGTIADTCSYYNEDIHTGAFLLPQNIKRIIGI
ncbi:MAG: polyamine aminopropyltransferase [Chitinispirillaceae bacterium]